MADVPGGCMLFASIDVNVKDRGGVDKLYALQRSKQYKAVQVWDKSPRAAWTEGWKPNLPVDFDETKDKPSEEIQDEMPLYTGLHDANGVLQWPPPHYVVLSTELAYLACKLVKNVQRGRW